MDIISQLQEQVNTIAALTYNTIGTLQRDAPPVGLSAEYPQPTDPSPEALAAFEEESKNMAAALVKAAKQFDSLVEMLPLSSEEEQLKRIAELEAENEEVGKELKIALEAAGSEFEEIRELFHTAADKYLGLKLCTN